VVDRCQRVNELFSVDCPGRGPCRLLAVLFLSSGYFQGPSYRGYIFGGVLNRDGCLLFADEAYAL
jgi:hypothetical protein